jgi:multiple sugar transport system substrate-binding protein
MGSKDGKVYVIPRSCDSVVTFINTDILAAAGVDLDPETTKVKNGWTWDDFMDVCAQVRTYMDANGMRNDYVFDANLTSWLSVCYPLLASYGAEVIDEDGNNTINSANTKACLEMVRELVNKRYINDSTVSTTGSFDNGRSAMLFQSASISLYAEKRALKDKVDLVSFPLVMENNTPKIGAGVAGYAINSKSKNKEVAWAFLTYLLSYQGQQNMANNGLNLASIRKDLSDPSTANWGLKYADLNLAAYTYGSEYKLATDFFVRTDLSAKAGIQQALKQLFTSASNASKDLDAIIKTAEADIDDAMIGY